MEKGKKGFEEERKGVPGPIGGRERGQQTAGTTGVREHAGLLTRAIVLTLEMIVALIALFVSLAVASGLMFSGCVTQIETRASLCIWSSGFTLSEPVTLALFAVFLNYHHHFKPRFNPRQQ
ncbi:hypothetical protein JOQ06_010207 [Pogonophryne albipinna]|uniref:Uncharacterized protein n=1 Tax=Pogonophryne albipinna TaxID=1090488 RepID=A0AAD6FFD1_9TELE|nr:hypothetical protein JOQ06_010207 [Pogonophryne albipinna]